MNRKIILQREIKVSCWRVQGTVAKSAKRSELIPVLLRASENGTTDAEDIAGHLWFEPKSRKVVAERLLNIASNFGLLTKEKDVFVLTEDGEKSINTGSIFVPELGTWTLWASDDPFLTESILCVKPWNEPSAYDEMRGKDKESAKEREIKMLPVWFRESIGDEIHPVTSGGASRRIDELEKNGEMVDPNTTLRVVWDVTEKRLRLEGNLDGRSVDSELQAPDVEPKEIWQELLQGEGVWEQWDEAYGALHVCLDETTPAERESMSRNIKFIDRDLDGWGEFDPFSVTDIPLRACSAADAKDWAKWRLMKRISDYATTECYAEWGAAAAKPFAEFQPVMPSRFELAHIEWQQRGEQPTPNCWHIVAAEDWRL